MGVRSLSSSQSDVYQTALSALRAGISCIPILADGTKRPAVRWKSFQHHLPTAQDIKRWFTSEKPYGLGFITGMVSGGLEMLDFDSREVYYQFVQRCKLEGIADLVKRIEHGYKELSPKGVHLYYRCPTSCEGNKKVAQCPLMEPPFVVSLIETRGEAGYSIGAPSSGGVHPSGQPYRCVDGSLETIQTLTPQDRAVLLSVARTFNRMPAHLPHVQSRKTLQRHYEGRRPGTIFNERVTWSELLEAHGWTRVKSIGGEDFWRRPGKAEGISATTNYEGSDYLYVFSTSTPLPTQRGIDKFGAYTLLVHHGDFAAATRALVALGYVDDEAQEQA